ncbi:hypothetical protein HML84_12680 [Alcanivorax sp. IO_7]|nr:hypothetical protein HML84_12680 [Alcanivorax sp. IO_7]
MKIKIRSFYNEYYNCLEKYENHENVDYLVSDYTSRDWYGKGSIKETKGALFVFIYHLSFYLSNGWL